MNPPRRALLALFVVAAFGLAPGAAQQAQPAKAPEIDPQWLESIRHDFKFGGLDGKPPDEGAKEALQEVEAFGRVVLLAGKTPAAAFEASALAHKQPSYQELHDEADTHRGKVVAFEGTLRLLSESPTAGLKKLGVPFVYLGWVDLHQPGTNPVVVAFSELPAGLTVDTKVQERVRLAGYYFKRFPYRGADDKFRTTLLVVAPTVTLEVRDPFWLNSKPAGVAAVAQIVGMKQPFGATHGVQVGVEGFVWGPPPGRHAAPPLTARLLPSVRDDNLFEDLAGKNAVRVGQDVLAEHQALCQALGYAWHGDVADFAASAEKQRDVKFADLVREPNKHRGQVVHLEGWVKRVGKIDAPKLAQADLKVVYEVWLTHDLDGGRPVCVLAANLPEALLKPGAPVGQRVEVNGYFFKLYRFMTDKGPVSAPLLIAPAVVILEAPEAAPVLDTELLRNNVRHDKIFADLRGKDPKDPKIQAPRLEIKAYEQAVVEAARTSVKAFEASARANDTLTFAHLMNQPQTNCGKVVTVEGKLLRLTHKEASRDLQDQGIRTLYEGWVVLDKPAGANAVCVVFPELPAGLKEGDGIEHQVRFSGYFFKRYPYWTGEEERKTVLLIGPTVTVLSSKTPPDTKPSAVQTFGGPLLTALVGLVGGTLVLIGVLSWWFKRGDQAVKRRLREYEASKFADDGANLDAIGNFGGSVGVQAVEAPVASGHVSEPGTGPAQPAPPS